MQKSSAEANLKIAIQELEYKQTMEWNLLRTEFLATSENLRPLNLIKNSFREVTTDTSFKNDLIGTAMGLAAGYLSNGLISGGSNNPVKKIVGLLTQLEVSTLITKNAETIKSVASNFVKLFARKKKVVLANDNHMTEDRKQIKYD